MWHGCGFSEVSADCGKHVARPAALRCLIVRIGLRCPVCWLVRAGAAAAVAGLNRARPGAAGPQVTSGTPGTGSGGSHRRRRHPCGNVPAGAGTHRAGRGTGHPSSGQGPDGQSAAIDFMIREPRPQQQAPAPGPGPARHLHQSGLPQARQPVRLRAQHPLRSRRPDLPVQRQPAVSAITTHFTPPDPDKESASRLMHWS